MSPRKSGEEIGRGQERRRGKGERENLCKRAHEGLVVLHAPRRVDEHHVELLAAGCRQKTGRVAGGRRGS